MRAVAILMAWAIAGVPLPSPAMDSAISTYLAARDNAISELNGSSVDNPALQQREQLALRKLEGMMQVVVGPIHLKGFPSNGTYNLDNLTGEIGFGKLDGIKVESFDGQFVAVVSTVTLLKHWLDTHPEIIRHRYKPGDADIDKALESEDFYSSALSDEARYYIYAELPVTTIGPSRAKAILFTAAQDDPAGSPPDRVLVAVVSGEEIVLMTASVSAPGIPLCVDAFERDSKEAGAAFEAYRSSHLRDKAQLSRSDLLGEKADMDYMQCYAGHLPSDSGFANLVKEAQAMVDKVQ